MVQLMPLPLTVSCFSKIQIGFTFLVPAHLGSPGKRAVKWVFVYIYIYIYILSSYIQVLNSTNIFMKSILFYVQQLHQCI